MPALTLTPAQRRTLRADAHHLSPVVMIGADGLTDSVIRETDAALNAHGLIKARVFSDDRPARESIWFSICDRLGAAPVQHIGKLLVVWRPVPEKPVEPRDDRKPGPRIVKLVTFSKSGNHRATVRKVRVLGNERLTPGGSIKRKETRAVSVKKKATD
jgi:putative YhbY family RNA-binding protein